MLGRSWQCCSEDRYQRRHFRFPEHQITLGSKKNGEQHWTETRSVSATSAQQDVYPWSSPRQRQSDRDDTVLMVVDVRRAYGYAKATRRVYQELPHADMSRNDGGVSLGRRPELGARAGRILGGSRAARWSLRSRARRGRHC